jgi:hypothetical protein
MTPYLWYLKVGLANNQRTGDEAHADMCVRLMASHAPTQWHLWYRFEPFARFTHK